MDGLCVEQYYLYFIGLEVVLLLYCCDQLFVVQVVVVEVLVDGSVVDLFVVGDDVVVFVMVGYCLMCQCKQCFVMGVYCMKCVFQIYWDLGLVFVVEVFQLSGWYVGDCDDVLVDFVFCGGFDVLQCGILVVGVIVYGGQK